MFMWVKFYRNKVSIQGPINSQPQEVSTNLFELTYFQCQGIYSWLRSVFIRTGLQYNILRFFIEDLNDNANYSMSFCFVRFYADFCIVVVFVVILSKTKKQSNGIAWVRLFSRPLTNRFHHKDNQRIHVTQVVIASAHDWSSVFPASFLDNEIFPSHHVATIR